MPSHIAKMHETTHRYLTILRIRPSLTNDEGAWRRTDPDKAEQSDIDRRPKVEIHHGDLPRSLYG